MKKTKSLWEGSFIRSIEYIVDIFVMILSVFLVIQFYHLITYETFANWNIIFNMYIRDYIIWILSFILITAIMLKVYKTSMINNSFTYVLKNLFMTVLFINIPLILMAIHLRINHQVYLLETLGYIGLVVLLELIIYGIYKYLFSKLLIKFNNHLVCIIGNKEDVEYLTKKLLLSKDKTDKIKYLIYLDELEKIDESIYPFIDRVDKIYLTQNMNKDIKNFIIEYAAFKNHKEVIMTPDEYEIYMMDAKFKYLDDMMVLSNENLHLSIENRILKRIFDIMVSITGLILTCIPMLVIALIIKLQDGGPVLFKQERLKLNKKPFNILKFRSMTYKQSKEDEQILASKNDPRFTKFGKLLRVSRFDELPQLINVLKGEMSIVGPRPLMKSVLDKATKDNSNFIFRSNVKPGITGLSHVYGRYDTTPEDRLRFDLYYIRKYSLWLDIKIIFLTVLVLFNKEAALGSKRNLSFEALLKIKNLEMTVLPSTKHCIVEIQSFKS